MSSDNGLIGSAAYRKPGVPYYLSDVPNPVIVAPTLIEPVEIKSQDLTTNATLYVDGAAAGAYQGAINISPGLNATAATGGAGMTIRTIAGAAAGSAATTVEVGTNAQGPNFLYVAGPAGVSEVYNERYNQPVALQTITIVGTNPVCAPTGGAEVFRCAQAGVDAADAGPLVFNRIQVPKTGAYMMQTEIRMGNGAGPNTVVLPSNIVGGVPLWYALQMSMTEFGTVIAVPYSSFEVLGGDFQAVETFESNSITIKTYSTVVFLDATKVYTVGLVSGNAAWNIGSAGQIKTELIAMC